jgi:hypothetical protein
MAQHPQVKGRAISISTCWPMLNSERFAPIFRFLLAAMVRHLEAAAHGSLIFIRMASFVIRPKDAIDSGLW